MHKILLQIITVVVMVLALSTGCTTTSEETVKSKKCEIVPPTEPVACTMQYDPVCGCDGKTYGNACMARGTGVPSSTPGACEKNLNKL